MELNTEPKVKVKRPDTKVEKIIKGILYFLIFSIIGITIYAHSVKDSMSEESENMIAQINRTQDLYSSMAGEYHFFSKTAYDATLGVETKDNRFFTAYAVVPSSDEQYEVKLYGRTNAFAIVYHDLKIALLGGK